MSVLMHRRALKPKTAAAFNPLTQVTPLHAVWLSDPAWTNPGDGNAIPSLRNSTGGGDPAASGTTRPTFRASTAALNNRSTAQFDGSDDWMTTSVSSVSGGWKFVFVGALTSAPQANTNLFGTGASINSGLGINAGNKWLINGGVTGLASSATPDTTAHVFVGDVNSGTSTLYMDGTSIASGTTSNSAWTDLRLGGGGTVSAARWTACHIAFLGIYAPATVTADLLTLGASLKTYYGTP